MKLPDNHWLLLMAGGLIGGLGYRTAIPTHVPTWSPLLVIAVVAGAVGIAVVDAFLQSRFASGRARLSLPLQVALAGALLIYPSCVEIESGRPAMAGFMALVVAAVIAAGHHAARPKP